MFNKKIMIALLLFCPLLMGIGAIARAFMPDALAVHWNASGQADGYGSTFMAIYFLPLVTLASGLLILAIPAIDPLKANIFGFRSALNTFVLAFAGYMGYIYLLTLAWNLGFRYNMNQLLAPGFALLLYFAGVLMGRAKRNFFIGIRTPWTLSNDLVWDRTHARGAVAFKICAAVSLLGILFPVYTPYFLMVPLLIAIAYLLFYSYMEYQRVTRP